ncbi:MAG: ThuA domain-containing protein [Pseudomonadales bacterium]
MPEASPHILLITKGHPFDKGAFFGMFDSLGVNYTHVEQPLAANILSVNTCAPYDALVFYDMPGIQFGDASPQFLTPSDEFKNNFQALLEAGQGMVFLHHAIAGWPAWEKYADILGGRFLYLPQAMRGKPRQDSGYRHQITHELRVANPDHPVAAGIPPTFSMTDELYLFEVFEDEVDPLLTSNYTFDDDHFFSATKAVRDKVMFSNEGWSHESGSSLVGWTKQVAASRLTYLQGGDDPVAYANPHYQRLIRNAIDWVAKRTG